jgi:hypothetical protein
MCPEIENHIDWTAAATPQGTTTGERVLPAFPARRPERQTPTSRGDIMDTLLGKNNLAAVDASGGDPYNAMGRRIRR